MSYPESLLLCIGLSFSKIGIHCVVLGPISVLEGQYVYSVSDSRMSRLQFAQKRQHCVVLGTDILCFLLFLHLNETTKNCHKQVYLL